MKAKKVFLGGTCNNSTWRDDLIKLIKIPFYNPVVPDWTPECQKEEIDQKENHCNVHLYVITRLMTGVFSIAEAVDSVHCKDKLTMFHVIPDGFGKGQLKSLEAVVNLIEKRGGIAYVDSDIERTALLLGCHS